MNKLFASDPFSKFKVHGVSAEANEAPLMELFRALLRRKMLIAATFALMMSVAVIFVLRVTPLYTAETMLMLEVERKGALIDLGVVVAGLPADVATIESEIEVLRSRGLARKVVERLGLDQHPEFNPILRPPGLRERMVTSIRASAADFLEEVTGWRPEFVAPLAPTDQPAVEEYRFSDVVSAFLDRRSVSSVGRSRAIRINFVSENPELAARATEALAELYIVERLEGNFEATREITNWLSARVQQLRSEVEAKEAAIEKFRQKHDLLEGPKGEGLLAQEISELNVQLVNARAARNEAEARLSEIQRLMARGEAGSAEAVLNSRLIQELRREEARIEAQVSDYATRFGRAHPTMRNALAQLADIRQTIDREIRKIAKGLENAVAVARNREAAFQTRMEEAKSRLGTSNSVEVEVRSLEQEAQAARQLLETFLEQLNASSTQQELVDQQADARVISHSDVPDRPSFPKTASVLALSSIAALLAGIGLALLSELLDNTFRSSEQVEHETGARVLGHIPRIKKWRHRRKGLAEMVVRKPRSQEAEAVRGLCTAIMLARRQGASSRILFTSGQPGEGKTSLCAAVARVQALAGRRVLLIDSDIRRPKIHKALGLALAPGLTDLLTGRCEFEEVIQEDPASGACVIASGAARIDSPQELLSSDAMNELLTNRSPAYDLVILDSPPVSAVSDALLLANLAELVFVVKWGGASKKFVAHALREVLNAGGKLIGIVLTQLDAEKHVKYGFGDSGAYSRAVQKYYVSD